MAAAVEREYLVYFKVNAGHALKGASGVLNEAKLENATLVFNKDSVTFVERSTKTDGLMLLITSTISGDNVSYYYDNPNKAELPFTMDVKDFVSVMQICNKVDGMSMYIYKDTPDALQVQFQQRKVNTDDQNAHVIKFQSVERKMYIAPMYTDQANFCRGNVTSLATIMTSLKRQRPRTISFRYGPTGSWFEYSSQTGTLNGEHTFGEAIAPPTVEQAYVLDKYTIGVLNKLACGVCTKNDNVTITMEPGRPLKFSTKLGNYGDFAVHVYNQPPDAVR